MLIFFFKLKKNNLLFILFFVARKRLRIYMCNIDKFIPLQVSNKYTDFRFDQTNPNKNRKC